MPTTEPASETIDGIKVVNICALLDHLFGVSGWFRMDPDVMNARVRGWIAANDAAYHAWEGESFLGLAEQDRGLAKAKASGKSILVIESLS